MADEQQDIIDSPEIDDPIYKTAEGQQVTHQQLLNSGYSEDRITKGLGRGVLSVVGNTNASGQQFKTSDGQQVTYDDLVHSGYSEDRINKGVQNGVLTAIEKKNPLPKDSRNGSGTPSSKSVATISPSPQSPSNLDAGQWDISNIAKNQPQPAPQEQPSISNNFGLDANKIAQGQQSRSDNSSTQNGVLSQIQQSNVKSVKNIQDKTNKMKPIIGSILNPVDNKITNGQPTVDHQQPKELDFDPAKFLKEDLAQPNNNTVKITDNSGIDPTNIIADQGRLAQYVPQRMSDIDKRITMLSKGHEGADEGFNAPQIKELKDYKNKLQQSLDYFAQIHAGVNGTTPEEAGVIRGKINGDPAAIQYDKFKKKGIPVSDAVSFNMENNGLQAQQTALDADYAGKPKDADYAQKKADIANQQATIFDRHPEYLKQQWGGVIGNYLSKNIPAWQKMSGLWAKNLNDVVSDMRKDGYNVPESVAKNIKWSDVPHNFDVSGKLLEGAYNHFSDLATGVERIAGNAVGMDKDKLDYAIQQGQGTKEGLATPDAGQLYQPQTITDTNPDSKSYMLPIPNPQAGKINPTGTAITDEIFKGLGGFGAFMASLGGGANIAKGAIGKILPELSGTADASKLAHDYSLASNVIIGGYEGNYQKAGQIIGDHPADEGKRSVLALTNSLIDYAIFKAIPTQKYSDALLGAKNSAAQGLGNLIKDLPSDLKGLSTQSVESVLKTKLLKPLVGALEETGKFGLAQNAGIILHKIAQTVVSGGNQESSNDANNVGKESADMWKNLPISMLPGVLGGEFLSAPRTSNLQKEGQYQAFSNPSQSIHDIHTALDEGIITPEEADKRIQVIVSGTNIVNAMPEKSPVTGKPFTHNESVQWVNNRIKEIALDAQKEGIKDDKVLTSHYDSKIKDLQDERQKILDGQFTPDVAIKKEESSSLKTNNNENSQEAINGQTNDAKPNAEGKGEEVVNNKEGVDNTAPLKDFADRIVNGEKITSPEDLQFYDNNKKAIEDELAARQKEPIPPSIKEGQKITVEPTRQEQINDLVGLTQKHNSARKNSAEQKALVQQIKSKANELGLNVEHIPNQGYIAIKSENGKKVQVRNTETNISEAKDFKPENYSPETHEHIDKIKSGELPLVGLSIDGADGRKLSLKQTERAEQDLKDGKITNSVKAVYDTIENSNKIGNIKMRDYDTGEETNIPIQDYHDWFKEPVKPLTDEEIQNINFNLNEDFFNNQNNENGQEPIHSETQSNATGKTEGNQNEAGDNSKESKLDSGSENKGKIEKVVPLQQIEKDANDIITGKKVFKRFSQDEQRGFTEGGQIHAEASLILGTGEGAGGKPEAQEQKIEDYAKQKGIWQDNTDQTLRSEYGKPLSELEKDGNQEATVWLSKDGKDVIKAQNTAMYGFDLQNKLDAITLHNSYFPEAPLKVTGFGRDKNGDFQVIVEQPFVKGTKLTPEEIRTYLGKIGFTKELDSNQYTDDKGHTIVEDIHTGNAIKTPEGNIVVIDPIMRLNTEEQGYGGKRKVSPSIETPPPPKEPIPNAGQPAWNDGMGISKGAFKRQRNFAMKFPERGNQLVFNETMDRLNNSAIKNNISPEHQAANEVELMKNKKGEASEHDIMTASYHLMNIDDQIAKANNDAAPTSHLVEQRNDALVQLRKLGNNAGRNLGLFATVFKKTEGNKVDLYRAEVKDALGVDDIPKTMKELEKSDLSPHDKKKVEPYVMAIEQYEKTIKDIEAKTKVKTKKTDDKEVEDYVKKEKATAPEKQQASVKINKEKTSSNLRDIAKKLRTSNEFDQFLKGKDNIQKQGISINYKEAFANAIEHIADLVEKGEKVADAIKSAAKKFKGDLDESEFGKSLSKLVTRGAMPDKDEVIKKIKETAKAENSNEITPSMVHNGFIKDVVNDYIHSDLPYDQVIKEATKELQTHLPETNEKQVTDALLKKGEFKPETKSKLLSESELKAQDIKRIATTSRNLRALEAASDIHEIQNDKTLSPTGKKAAIEKRKSDYEKSIDAKIKDLQDQKNKSENDAKEAKIEELRQQKQSDAKNAEDYKRLETERNRQLKIVNDLQDKKAQLEQGIIDKKDKNPRKEDTPEIEGLRKEVSQITKDLNAAKSEHNKAERDFQSQVRQKINRDNKMIETERNRQLQKVADLKGKLDKLQNGIREKVTKNEPIKDTPEIEDLKKQVKEADNKLRETDAAQKKAIDDTKRIADNAAKEAQRKADKLAEINKAIEDANREKKIYQSAIKNPKQANEDLKNAKQKLNDAYNKNGIRPERGNKTEIEIAQSADNEIKSIKDNPDLDEATKKEHIKAIEDKRDAQINGTKQGVLTSLRTAIDNHLNDLTNKQSDVIKNGDSKTADEIQNLKDDLNGLRKNLNPNGENLKDQIDKADQDLNAIIKGQRGTEYENDLNGIKDNFHKDWQKTSDELQRQQLLNKAISDKKELDRKLAAGQYTEIPTTPYDVSRDQAITEQEAENRKAFAQLQNLKNKAEADNETKTDRVLNARRSFMIATFGAIEKVAGSGLTKPIIDPLNRQTWGRLSGKITGIKPSSRVSDSFRQFKNDESASKYMRRTNENYVQSVIKLDQAQRGGNEKEIKAATRQMMKAEIAHSSSLGNLFLNANSAIDIKQIIVNGATDLDASLGKYKQSTHAERMASKTTNLGKITHETGYWLESVNRTHGAIKSVSHRQAILDLYVQNLQYFQKQEGNITTETRLKAWDKAVIEAEEGRFGENTHLSDQISKWKGSDNPFIRYPARVAFAVAKIGINITKQGVDRAFPFVEAAQKTLITGAIKGIKLNAQDGIEFNHFAKTYYEGIKRGFNELPYERKKYINTLLARGMAGSAQYALAGALLAAGAIRFGGAYNSNDPFHKKYGTVLGSDGEPLKNGEWEFFGSRCPKLLNLVLNHSPYILPTSLAADFYHEATEEKGTGFKGFNDMVNEVIGRLPVSTVADVYQGLTGDEYKASRSAVSLLPSAKNTAEYFDQDEEGNPVQRKSDSKGFMGKTFDMWRMNIPGLRNQLPEKESTQRATNSVSDW